MNGPTGAAGIGPNGNGDLTMLDSSGYGRTATVPAGVTWYRNSVAAVGTTLADPAFLAGGALLAGGNGYMTVPRASLPYLAGDLTLEFLTYWSGETGFFWVLSTAGTAAAPIREFNLGLSAGALVFYHGDGSTNLQVTIPGCTLVANNYAHIALTRNQYSREVVCYKNGVEVGKANYAASPASSPGTGDLMVGAGFPGYLDELAIWNRVIPADRIAAHYARRTSNSTSTRRAVGGSVRRRDGPAIEYLQRRPSARDLRQPPRRLRLHHDDVRRRARRSDRREPRRDRG